METITSSSPSISSSELLNRVTEIGPILQQYTQEERVNRRLSKSVIDTLRQAGLFRLYLPKSLGGIEADPLTTARITEEVAHYNTAAGWTLMVANTSNWWSRNLTDEGIKKIYANGPDTFIAGAFHPPMKATRVKDGYIINGRSPLASNVHEAQWIFATAMVMENDQPKINNGRPEMIGALMDANDCKILDTWYTIGMNATDSNDFSAHEVFVPYNCSFSLGPSSTSNTYFLGPLYRFPGIWGNVASLIIPVALAVARNAVEELKILATKKVPYGSAVALKDRSTVQRKIGMAEAMIQSGRAYLHQEIASIWNKTLNEEVISLEERARLLLACTHTNQTCAQAVELIYSAAGTTGIYTTNKLANYFTDAQVIRQHGFSNDSRYESAGQIYLGVQCDLPVIMF